MSHINPLKSDSPRSPREPLTKKVRTDDSFKASSSMSENADKAARVSIQALSYPKNEEALKSYLQKSIEQGLQICAHFKENNDIEIIQKQLIVDAELMAEKVTESLDKSKADSLQPPSSPVPYYTLVHELRTPLQNLIGLLSLPIDDPQEFLQQLHESYQALHNLLNDIPNSPDEATQLILHLAPFTIRDLHKQVQTQIFAYAPEKGIKVNFTFPDHSDQSLIGDKQRIAQILQNFISNAIKYSKKESKVDVAIEFDKKKAIVFKVKDYGSGISEENQKKLFRPFSQVNDSSSQPISKKTKTVPSSGIGLYFCKKVAELMNDGKTDVIGVKSSLGSGSEFWVTIPYREEPSIRATPIAKLSVKGLKTLLADDSLPTRKLMSRYLKDAKIDAVENGNEAIAKVEEAVKNEENYDIVILDMNMPGPNGAKTAKRICEIAKQKMPHIFISSGNPKEEIKKELADEGLEKEIVILTKPVRPVDLITAINQKLKS